MLSIDLYALGVLVQYPRIVEPLTVTKRIEPTSLQVGDTAVVAISVQSSLDKDIVINVTDRIQVDFVILSSFSEFRQVKKVEGSDEIVVTWIASLSPRDTWLRSYEVSPVSGNKRVRLPQAAADWNGTTFYSRDENIVNIEEKSLFSYFLVAAYSFFEKIAITLIASAIFSAGSFLLGARWQRRKLRR